MTILFQAAVNRASLWSLPNLRILIVTDVFMTWLKPSFRQALIESFNRLPKLEYVVVESRSMNEQGNRFSVSQRNDGGAAVELRCEQICRQYDQGRPVTPWWTEHERI
jgi:hypothetical protein